jgi:hypothetical protein
MGNHNGRLKEYVDFGRRPCSHLRSAIVHASVQSMGLLKVCIPKRPEVIPPRLPPIAMLKAVAQPMSSRLGGGVVAGQVS